MVYIWCMHLFVRVYVGGRGGGGGGSYVHEYVLVQESYNNCSFFQYSEHYMAHDVHGILYICAMYLYDHFPTYPMISYCILWDLILFHIILSYSSYPLSAYFSSYVFSLNHSSSSNLFLLFFRRLIDIIKMPTVLFSFYQQEQEALVLISLQLILSSSLIVIGILKTMFR